MKSSVLLPNMTKAALLDFETTGLEPATGQVIEGAIVLVGINPDNSLGPIIESYTSLNDPGAPLPAEIRRITGIDDGMVRGKKLEWARFVSVCSQAEILIAHNARFDRAWLESKTSYRAPRWGCTQIMIDWKGAHWMPCSHLKHIAWEHDYFPTAHRALDDVMTLIHLLRLPQNNDSTVSYAQELMANAKTNYFMVKATGAPIETKDVLKKNGFRWDREERVWWKVVGEQETMKIRYFLRHNVYSGEDGYLISGPVDPLTIR